ncbi:siderophore-interacting protein, partial [Streptomyces nigra]
DIRAVMRSYTLRALRRDPGEIDIDFVLHTPALVNSAPFEGGWLFKVRVTEEPADLLSADEYDAHTAG